MQREADLYIETLVYINYQPIIPIKYTITFTYLKCKHSKPLLLIYYILCQISKRLVITCIDGTPITLINGYCPVADSLFKAAINPTLQNLVPN